MPPAHRGPTGSPMDRWTDASPSAISSGFQTAMSLGPQPSLTGLSRSMTSASFANTDDEDDDDDDEDADGGSPANATGKKANGKVAKGKKAAGGSAAAGKGKDARAAQHRKEQNRAAQREFRQRKQQYIRALEARVELLSSDHDTQVNRLRFALRHLLAENNTLRGIVGNLAHFIGKRSIGGCLVESGMTPEMLEATMNSSSEKVMSEAWANWPGAGECEALKQIRKESNIPADGLPESKLINYFRDAQGKNGNDATPSSDATTADKKKRSVDDASSKNAKRKRKTDDVQITATNSGSNPATASSAQSSPSAQSSMMAPGQPFTSSPQMMGTNQLDAAQQQQQQAPPQPQMPYTLPTQFWQPTQIGFPRQDSIGVDAMFAQTLLGGGNSDLSSLASLFPNEAGVNQNLFPQANATGFNTFAPTSNGDGGGGPIVPSGASNFLPFGTGFAPSAPGFAQTSGAPSMGSTAAPTAAPVGATHISPSRVIGGVETLIIPSSSRLPPEYMRNLRRRWARCSAQVNRIWAKRGATSFLNLPNDYRLDDDDVRFIEHDEATNPHTKIAYIRLPNEWDEGDLSVKGNGRGSTDGSSPYDIDDKADRFLQLTYHMNNYRLNPNYSLPPVLKMSQSQLSTPHDPAIDSLPWPSIRDKMIQMPQLDTHSVVIDLCRFLSVGDGDVNSEKTWVLTLPFLIRYPQLADAALLANTNAQRVARGEGEVTMEDVWKEHARFQEYTQAKLKEMS
ncbi:hypothetical protein PHSY_003684 [Pseudozyma hubeiensis SY62]|uniref:BZIP domain-containing protein n=1 Tax=Pseudozyma hubeiensis (strain SY62) TaxID=1305764 RepID=R9P471_PSEHS|nr:hypothetical protein PHSY_003684 [Pseudozyma hubeiensis SY62]GAC96104.1 hypothetical protein PHSY_003684 [Pseudozyma hubeiensis SY62]